MVDTVIASYSTPARRRGTRALSRSTPSIHVPRRARTPRTRASSSSGTARREHRPHRGGVRGDAPRRRAADGLKPSYHVYARSTSSRPTDVRCYQIPDRILADFGLDVRTELVQRRGRTERDRALPVPAGRRGQIADRVRRLHRRPGRSMGDGTRRAVPVLPGALLDHRLGQDRHPGRRRRADRCATARSSRWSCGCRRARSSSSRRYANLARWQVQPPARRHRTSQPLASTTPTRSRTRRSRSSTSPPSAPSTRRTRSRATG